MSQVRRSVWVHRVPLHSQRRSPAGVLDVATPRSLRPWLSQRPLVRVRVGKEAGTHPRGRKTSLCDEKSARTSHAHGSLRCRQDTSACCCAARFWRGCHTSRARAASCDSSTPAPASRRPSSNARRPISNGGAVPLSCGHDEGAARWRRSRFVVTHELARWVGHVSSSSDIPLHPRGRTLDTHRPGWTRMHACVTRGRRVFRTHPQPNGTLGTSGWGKPPSLPRVPNTGQPGYGHAMWYKVRHCGAQPARGWWLCGRRPG